MSDRRLAFVYTPEVERLSYPPDCPFKTGRVPRTRRQLRSFGLLGSDDRVEVAPTPATREDLEVFHEPRYLDALARAAGGDLTVEGLHRGLGGPDTPVFAHLFEYGAWACGGSLTGADLLLSGGADVAFALLGGFHHAFAGKAAGFCYLNDVVLACERLARGGRRVLYLDIDAHHGDGVQTAFYRRADVLTVSFHESGKTLYPWGGFEHEIGEGPGRGFNVNVPVPAGTFDAAYVRAFRRIVPPLMAAFQPDALVVELGMDTLAGDPLTHLTLTNNAPMDILADLLHTGLPLLVLGGGGYHVQNTVRGWTLAWRVACGEDDEDLSAGFGGVMLSNNDWTGGLRDPVQAVNEAQRGAVEAELETSLRTLEREVLPLHGLSVKRS